MSTIIPLSETSLPADCVVYKHSTTCGISSNAAREVRAMTTSLPIYWINVREQRDLSTWFATAYGVEHQSPQLILVKGGKADKVWSHYEIHRSNVAD